MGGGDDSWGARTDPEYMLPAKPYSKDMGDANTVARQTLPEVK